MYCAVATSQATVRFIKSRLSERSKALHGKTKKQRTMKRNDTLDTRLSIQVSSGLSGIGLK